MLTTMLESSAVVHYVSGCKLEGKMVTKAYLGELEKLNNSNFLSAKDSA